MSYSQSFRFYCKKLLHKENTKDGHKVVKRMLTEYLQKAHQQQIYKFKKKLQCEKDNKFICPCCYTKCNSLDGAHVGGNMSNLIELVLREHSYTTNVITLMHEVIKKHQNIELQICCRNCNHDFDEERENPNRKNLDDNVTVAEWKRRLHIVKHASMSLNKSKSRLD